MIRTKYHRAYSRQNGRHIQNQSTIYNIRHFCFKYRVIVYCSIIAIILFLLHKNFIRQSYVDKIFQRRCIEKADTHHKICSFMFGFMENICIFFIVFISFLIFFPLYWRLRYLNKIKCCESISLSFLDPFLLSFPWFLSPLLSFHSITSLIIHICVLIQSTKNATLISECNVIRTCWSVMLWVGLDILLWSNFSLFYLFDKGPNKIFSMILPYHFKQVKQILSSHLYYIDDLVELILAFEGNHIVWKLIDMKQNLSLSLSESNLSKPFYYLTIITVLISSVRLLLSPEAVGVLFPLLVAFGIIVIITAIIIFLMALLSALTGGNMDCNSCSGSDCNDCYSLAKVNCCDKSPACKICTGLFGGLVASALWGWIIWIIMNRKLKKMKDVQQKCKAIDNIKYNDEIELHVGTGYQYPM
eukprot:142189_1